MAGFVILGGVGLVGGLVAGFALGGLRRPFVVVEIVGLALATAYSSSDRNRTTA